LAGVKANSGPPSTSLQPDRSSGPPSKRQRSRAIKPRFGGNNGRPAGAGSLFSLLQPRERRCWRLVRRTPGPPPFRGYEAAQELAFGAPDREQEIARYISQNPDECRRRKGKHRRKSPRPYHRLNDKRHRQHREQGG